MVRVLTELKIPLDVPHFPILEARDLVQPRFSKFTK